MSYYYPEGSIFGPVCDALISDSDIASSSRRALPEQEEVETDKWPDEEGWIHPVVDGGFWGPTGDIYEDLPAILIGTKCKVRDDGTYYDCENVYLGNITTGDGGPNENLGESDNFVVPTLTSASCTPYYSDVNIKPITCYKEDGTTVEKTKEAKSNPITYAVDAWSGDAQKYGVWVNPEQCTLPNELQTVTYQIEILEAGTYGFTFGSDAGGSIFLNDSETPLLTASSMTSPVTGTATLSVGTLKLTVTTTNGTGDTWDSNPGGWFIKMCFGGVCGANNSIGWVKAGPHHDWSDFMNEYAVYPSNINSMVGTAHTATWNVTPLHTGYYILEVQADSTADITWDGVAKGTVTSNSSSTFITITGVTPGPHTIGVTLTNTSQADNTWAGNPGGIAFTLRSQMTNIEVTSLDLEQPADSGLVWTTRNSSGWKFSGPCCTSTGISDAGYGEWTQGYLSFNDGTTIRNPYRFITGLVPGWSSRTVKTGYTYQQVYDQLVTSYGTIISRRPEADGFDYWINSFKNNSWNLSDLNNSISLSANDATNGELLLHTARGGLSGNFDVCGNNLM